MKQFLLVFSGLLACISSMQAQLHKHALFLGNSYTYVNDLPTMISQLALSAGDTLSYDSNTLGGYTLANHTANATSISKIELGGWDYVVLQEQSQIPSFPLAQVETDVFPYAAYLDSVIVANNDCAETVFYMTWGRKNGDAGNCEFWPPVCTYEGMDDLLRERYLQMAMDNAAITSPVGAVWRYIRENNPDIELYQADESHPSLAGTYAAACCFYSSLFRQSSLEITDNQGLDAATAAYIRTVVNTLVYQDLLTWQIGTQDPDAEFGYSITQENWIAFENLSNVQTCFWNFGDGTTSIENNPVHVYSNGGLYNVTLTVSDCGMVDSTTIQISAIASIEPFQLATRHALHPNPANAQTIIEGIGQLHFVLIATTGQIVHPPQLVKLPYALDTRDLPNGIYLLRDLLQPNKSNTLVVLH